MYHVLQQRLQKIEADNLYKYLRESRTGLEKESLRVNQDGYISQTPHPAVLGAALTHPWITTDYAESLLELITPPQRRARLRRITAGTDHPATKTRYRCTGLPAER